MWLCSVLTKMNLHSRSHWSLFFEFLATILFVHFRSCFSWHFISLAIKFVLIKWESINTEIFSIILDAFVALTGKCICIDFTADIMKTLAVRLFSRAYSVVPPASVVRYNYGSWSDLWFSTFRCDFKRFLKLGVSFQFGIWSYSEKSSIKKLYELLKLAFVAIILFCAVLTVPELTTIFSNSLHEILLNFGQNKLRK